MFLWPCGDRGSSFLCTFYSLSRAVAVCFVLCVISNNICKPVALFDEFMMTGRIQTDDNCINIGYVTNETMLLYLNKGTERQKETQNICYVLTI
jgi:hypothetical protein